MIYTIDEIKAIITPICQKYGVKRAYLFGSYSRGEATESSDIDIRIETGKIRSLLTMSSFRIDLVEALHKEVDLISAMPTEEDILYDLFWKNLKKDALLIYNRSYKHKTNLHTTKK